MDKGKKTGETNLKLNEILEDNKVRASTEETSESTSVNIQLQNAFYGNQNDFNSLPPTYIYNNTPSIKITGDDD